MNKIFTLPESVVSKIAAGEVIERPAFAVKELIENALDAKATNIEIRIEESGLKKIIIIDNGVGMSREDLKICFLPHTTSKLKSEEELLRIQTFGFRGEALSSIAAISNVTIKSKTEDDIAGTVIEIKNGGVQNLSSIGMPKGTQVVVDYLFFSVPARRKFLKSQLTEFRLTTDIITNYALSFPKVHFSLIHNGKEILNLSKKEIISDRLKVLLGDHFFNNVVPFSFEENHIKLSGFIGKPQIASKQNQKQYLFINSRSVTDKLISLAVKESYGTLLPASYTPVFLIFVTMPSELVDINVHPRKETVSFINSKGVFDTTKQAIIQTLSDSNITFSLSKFKEEPSLRFGETRSLSANQLKKKVLTINKASLILQIDKTYLIVSTKNGIVMLDQHAAHERILYEEFVITLEKEKQKNSQYTLPKLLFITLSVSDIQILEEYKDLFIKVGFTIEPFQGKTILIRKIPSFFKGRNIGKILLDMISDLKTSEGIKSIDTGTERMISFLACRGAVKAGDSLSGNQAKDIIMKLQKTKNNPTCPHGRPTHIEMSVTDLDILFKRI